MILRQFLHTEPVAISYLLGCGGKGAAAVIAPLGEMGFDVPALSIYLEGFGNDPAEGARRAAEVLRQWLPDEAELTITLGGEPLD